jgi:hypothetical protein
MRKFSIVIFAFLLFTNAFTVFAQDESRVSKTWEVQKYDITATLPQSESDRYLAVKANLNLKNVSSSAASRLTLRVSPSAEVSSVRINDAVTDFTKGEEKIGGNRNLQRILLRLPSIQAGANFSVAVDYKLKVEENSGLNALFTSWFPISAFIFLVSHTE